MAYRRSYRRKARRGYRKSRTPRRLSKHMVRAIKAISQVPVETKHFPLTATIQSYLNTAAYSSGPFAVIRGNIFSDIPRLKNTGVKTENSFVGNQIQARGLRWWIELYPSTATNAPPLQMRFTVYRDNRYFASTTGVGIGDRIFDQDHVTTPTWSTWNQQDVKVMFQRRFTLKRSTSDPGMVKRKFWIPIRKKVESQDEESLVFSSIMGEIKGPQYYWVLEVFSPSSTDIRTDVIGNVDWNIYFKDA